MRRWHGGIPTGCRPEASNVADDSVDGAALSWIVAIDSSLKAERLDRVLHHEGLHRNRTPRIKNAKPQVGGAIHQQRLRVQQPLHHPGSEPKWIGGWTIGSPQGGIGVGLQPNQWGRQGLQLFS